MSLINKMLQELDKRHAAQGAGLDLPDSSQLAQNLRPVKSARLGSELFWWVMSGVMVVAIVWLAWVMWQLMPRTLVNPVALQSVPKVRQAAPVGSDVQRDSNTSIVAGPPDAPAISATVPRAAGTGGNAPRVDMLRLATEITTPIPARQSRPPGTSVRPAAPVAEVPVRPAPATPVARDTAKSGAASGAPLAASSPGPLPAKPAPASPTAAQALAKAARAPAAPSVVPPTAIARIDPRAAAGVARSTPKPMAAPDNGRIDKRVTPAATARERADTDYRRGLGLVNQGRVSEGMEALQSALALDGSYEPVRQTLAALLLEQRRIDEAAGVLQQGLEVNPANDGFAMLLARILVERGSLRHAVAILQKHAPAAVANPDYHALLAALYQRLNRHTEAIEEYQSALRLSPKSGVWWVGLGMSQEASDLRKDALESFRQARAAGNLAGDLPAYVDQRLKQLQ